MWINPNVPISSSLSHVTSGPAPNPGSDMQINLRVLTCSLCLVDNVTSNKYQSKILALAGFERETNGFLCQSSTSTPRGLGRETGLLG